MDGKKLANTYRGTNITFQDCPSVKSPSYRATCEPINTVHQSIAKHELTRAQKSIHYSLTL